MTSGQIFWKQRAKRGLIWCCFDYDLFCLCLFLAQLFHSKHPSCSTFHAFSLHIIRDSKNNSLAIIGKLPVFKNYFTAFENHSHHESIHGCLFQQRKWMHDGWSVECLLSAWSFLNNRTQIRSHPPLTKCWLRNDNPSNVNTAWKHWVDLLEILVTRFVARIGFSQIRDILSSS